MKPSTYLESYLGAISPDVATVVAESVEEFGDKYLDTFDYKSRTNGLVAGHVQSGKTGQMLGIISAAADLDFKLFIILTTDNVRLQEQTVVRSKLALSNMIICDENDDVLFRKTSFIKPVLLILKKNKRVLESWFRNISMHKEAKFQPIIMLDDEGDAASLNTLINKNETSTINSLVNSIVNLSPSSLYLTVTATPYANLLQLKSSGMKPDFAHVIKPGENYLGGDFFYNTEGRIYLTEENEKQELLETASVPKGFRKAIVFYLFACVEFKLNRGIETCNFLIHPSLKISDHEFVKIKTIDFLQEFKSEVNKKSPFFDYWIKDCYQGFSGFNFTLNEFTDCVDGIIDSIEVYTVNSVSSGVSFDEGFNVIVGGNSLGRGVTFPRLQVTYYCRTSRTPQADTVWQHSRLFGYDREKDICKVFMPPSLKHLFREFTETNEALLGALEAKGVDGLSIITPAGTRPTRKSVVEKGRLVSLAGGVNYFSEDVDDQVTDGIDEILGTTDKTISLSCAEVIGLLETLCPSEQSDLDIFISCLLTLMEKGYGNCRVHIRANRNISKGTGTLLSPDDRTLSQENSEEIVLFMYRLNGKTAQGWRDKEVWVPNIRFPIGICFHSVEIDS